jgi:hypothetical protein
MRLNRGPFLLTARVHAHLLVLCLALPQAPSAWSQTSLTLDLRDADSGAPTSARVQVLGPDGYFFGQPDPQLLTHASSATGPYVHATDSLVLDGPEGTYHVWVSRGTTSVPQFHMFEVDVPQRQTISIADWIDPASDGWLSGDPHTHASHPQNSEYPGLTPAEVAIAARAEGLDLMYLLDNDPLHPGGPVVPAQPGVHLVWGEEYRNSFWGHTAMLGLETLVTWSGAGCCGSLLPAWPTLTWTFENEDEGLSILAHPRSTDEPLEDFAGWPGSGYAREQGVLALGDQLDGFAVASASNWNGPWALDDYLDALRLGARWAAVGEGDRALDRYFVSPPGQPRTYAWTGADPGGVPLSEQWEEAIRLRRCFATTGPIITRFEVGAVPMGGETALGAPGTVNVELAVAAYSELTHVALHGATGTHWSFDPESGRSVLDTMLTIPVDHDDFFVLDVTAEKTDWPELVFQPRAVSSPVWVSMGSPWPRDPDLVREQSDELDAFFAQAVSLRGFDSPADSFQAWLDIVGAAEIYEAMIDDPPAEFALLQPEDGDQIPGVEASLLWTPSVSHDGEPVSYRLRVATEPSFSDPVVDLVTTDTWHQFDGEGAPAQFYWMVEALEPDEPPTPSTGGAWSFYLTGGVVSAPSPFDGPPLGIEDARTGPRGFQVALRTSEPMPVRFRWIDVRGRVVARQDLGRFESGIRPLLIPLRSDSGQPLARGVYWAVFESGSHRAVARVVWLR